jgi:hypothetical protein
MGNARRKHGTQRSADQSGRRRTGLEKATAAEKVAEANVTRIRKKLIEAVRTLATAKAGSAKEDKSRRAVGAATKDLIAAKKKLRKAQKKRKKAAAQLEAKRGEATAVRITTPARRVRTRRISKRKPAQANALTEQQKTPGNVAPATADVVPEPLPTDAEPLGPQ